MVEGVVEVDHLEAGQNNLNLLFKRLTGASAEVVIDTGAYCFSNTSKRVLPNQLL